MRKRVSIVVGLLVLATLFFGAGLLVQRQIQLVSLGTAERLARGLTGEDKPIPPAPNWESLHYQRANKHGSITGSSLRLMGELVQPAGHYAAFTTPDDFKQVAAFYAEKCGFHDPKQIAASTGAVSSYGEVVGGESIHLLDDMADPKDPQQRRPMRAKCLIRRCRSYDLTVFITRTEGEDHTHILLVYDPIVETEE